MKCCSNCDHLCMMVSDSNNWGCDVGGAPVPTYLNDCCDKWLLVAIMRETFIPKRYINNAKFVGRTMHGFPMYKEDGQ